MAEKLDWNNLLEIDISLTKVMNDKSKEVFYAELASLLESGIGLKRTIEIIGEETKNKRTRIRIKEIENDIVLGKTLSHSLSSSGSFSSYEWQSVAIGEETGKLIQVLNSLQAFFSEKIKLKRQLVSVFSYPLFVLAITGGVIYFMLNSVVPMFEDVFKQFNQDLPLLTQRIIWLSEHFYIFLIGFFILFLGFGGYLYTQRKEDWFRNYSSRFVLGLPIIGKLVQKIYITRFCTSMALLTRSKTPLVVSLELVKDMIGFYPIEKALSSAIKTVTKGEPLHRSLSEFPIFESRVISLIKIAEEINKLDATFERLSKQNSEQIEHQTKLMGSIIEPAIIVLIGTIVGLIMVSMYLPMFNLSNVIK